MLIRYDAEGRIVSVATTYARHYAAWAALQTDLSALEVASDRDPAEMVSGWYVVDGALVARPTMAVAPSLDVPLGGSAVLGGLPLPCRVIHDGGSIEVADGAMTLTGDTADAYTLTIEAWPHLSATVAVVVA